MVTLLLSVSYGATVVVSPGNMGSWAFVTTDNTGTPGDPGYVAQMVNGPATPPLGMGSARIEYGTGSLAMSPPKPQPRNTLMAWRSPI